MKKQKVQLVAVLVLLAVVLSSFLLLREWNRREDAKTDAETVSLLSLDASSVTGITVRTETEGIRYQLIRDGESWAVRDASGGNLPAKADIAQQMLDAVISLEGTHPIANAANLSQYGLEPPGMTIEIETETEAGQARVHVIEIGDLSTAASMYYARMDGAGDVYLITTLVKSLYDVQPDTLMAEDADNDS